MAQYDSLVAINDLYFICDKLILATWPEKHVAIPMLFNLPFHRLNYSNKRLRNV